MELRLSRSRRRLSALAALALLLSPAFAVRAADAACDRGSDAATVVLAGDASYPPFHFATADGSASGFDVELMRAVGAHADLCVVFELGDWSEVLDRLASGKVDVVPMFISAERQNRFLFSKPFLQRHHLVFGPRGAAFIEDLQQLRGQRVAVQFAGLAWEALSAMDGPLIVPVSQEAHALLQVQRGAAEYALVPMTIGYGALRELKITEVVALSPPVLSRDYAFAVTPDRPELVGRINESLRVVSRNGEQDKLYVHWLANMTRPEESYRSGMMMAAWLALPLMGLLFVLMRYWRKARREARAQASSRREAEARASHLAFHDPITGLLNRNGLRQQLVHLMQEAGSCVVVRVDLLEIGSVEAIAGQEFVEQLLSTIAQRLSSMPGASLVATVGRRGFDVVFAASDHVVDPDDVIRSTAAVVQTTFELDRVPIHQTCRLGAAVFPDHATTADALLRAAAVACAAAHETGAWTLLYSAALEPDPRNLTLLGDLRESIRAATLGYMIQPKIDLPTGRIVGGELLVRWDHPRYGALSPGEFVPLAERTRVIGEMTVFLVAEAAGCCRKWLACGMTFTLSVNVSVNDLSDPALVARIIERTVGVGHLIVLEVTETALMREPEQVMTSVDRLRGAGLRISLDDFGTGHSSLAYLRQLSPDEVKIDRSFIIDVLRSAADQAIVRSMIGLAHSLSAYVTAEGVEDAETLAWLTDAGCDLAQGYEIARPMPVGRFTELLGSSMAMP